MKNVLIISSHPDLSTSVAEETETPIMCSVKQQDNPNLADRVESHADKAACQSYSATPQLMIIRKKRRRMDDAPATAKN